MPLEARLLAGLTLAMAIAYASTPLAIRVAARFDFYDLPGGYKTHGAPTPYLGGAAVITAFAVAALALTSEPRQTLPVLGGVLVLWAVGTLDDRRVVPPWQRITVEVGLAAVLWTADLGWSLGVGSAVDLLATAVWVVAVVNAFNLFDNMDGASSTMAGVVAAAVAVIGLVQSDVWLVATGAALCGACLGFLPHNLSRPSARIFLGDGGSMPIGFAIAALVMIGASSAAAEWEALVMGVLLVGVPALDTCLVVVSRRRRGISILSGGRDHLTHRTRARMRTAHASVAALGAGQALLAALTLVAVQGGTTALVPVVLAYLVATVTVIALVDSQSRATPAGEAAAGSTPKDAPGASHQDHPRPAAARPQHVAGPDDSRRVGPLARAEPVRRWVLLLVDLGSGGIGPARRSDGGVGCRIHPYPRSHDRRAGRSRRARTAVAAVLAVDGLHRAGIRGGQPVARLRHRARAAGRVAAHRARRCLDVRRIHGGRARRGRLGADRHAERGPDACSWPADCTSRWATSTAKQASSCWRSGHASRSPSAAT